MSDSTDTEIAKTATEILESISENPSYLMIDEQKLLRGLGVRTTKPYVRGVYYYEGTERISVLYHAATSTQSDAMRVAFKCPPDDEVKRAKVEKWMWSESESERREEIQREIGGLKDEL